MAYDAEPNVARESHDGQEDLGASDADLPSSWPSVAAGCASDDADAMGQAPLNA